MVYISWVTIWSFHSSMFNNWWFYYQSRHSAEAIIWQLTTADQKLWLHTFTLSKSLTKSHNNGFITPISYKQDQYTVNGDRLLIPLALLEVKSSADNNVIDSSSVYTCVRGVALPMCPNLLMSWATLLNKDQWIEPSALPVHCWSTEAWSIHLRAALHLLIGSQSK